MVRGEWAQFFDGVVVGLGRHEDVDGGDLGHLGDALRVDKLLVGVVRNLVVDGSQVDGLAPGQAHRVGRHLGGPQVEDHVSRLDLFLHSVGQPNGRSSKKKGQGSIIPINTIGGQGQRPDYACICN